MASFHSDADQDGNNSKPIKDFDLKATARIWL